MIDRTLLQNPAELRRVRNSAFYHILSDPELKKLWADALTADDRHIIEAIAMIELARLVDINSSMG